MRRKRWRQPVHEGARITIDLRQHWSSAYTAKGEGSVSWFEAFPAVSLQLIEAAGLTDETCVLDVGGGESRLVDALLARGVTCLGVRDVAVAPLHRAQTRLGEKAITRIVQRAAERAGLDESRYSALSLRLGMLASARPG